MDSSINPFSRTFVWEHACILHFLRTALGKVDATDSDVAAYLEQNGLSMPADPKQTDDHCSKGYSYESVCIEHFKWGCDHCHGPSQACAFCGFLSCMHHNCDGEILDPCSVCQVSDVHDQSWNSRGFRCRSCAKYKCGKTQCKAEKWNDEARPALDNHKRLHFTMHLAPEQVAMLQPSAEFTTTTGRLIKLYHPHTPLSNRLPELAGAEIQYVCDSRIIGEATEPWLSAALKRGVPIQVFYPPQVVGARLPEADTSSYAQSEYIVFAKQPLTKSAGDAVAVYRSRVNWFHGSHVGPGVCKIRCSLKDAFALQRNHAAELEVRCFDRAIKLRHSRDTQPAPGDPYKWKGTFLVRIPRYGCQEVADRAQELGFRHTAHEFHGFVALEEVVLGDERLLQLLDLPQVRDIVRAEDVALTRAHDDDEDNDKDA